MGAGASSMEEGATMLYCHSCHRTSTMNDRTDTSDLSCPSCDSSFIEEMAPSRAPRHRISSQEDLSSDQTRRLANAAIMLRLLESQLQSELEQLQTVLSEDDNLMSPIMKKKLRRVDLDVDMICSQPSCPICAMDFEVGSEKLILPCNHLYCEDCVTPWLDKKKTCPICRFTLTNEVPTAAELLRFSYMELKDLHAEVEAENTEDLKKDSAKDSARNESKFRSEAGQIVNPALGITVDADRLSDVNDIDTATSESGAKSITNGSQPVNAKRELAEEINKLLQIKKDRDEYQKRRNLGEVINANRARTLRQLLRGQSLLNDSSGGSDDTSSVDPLREGRRTEEERRANPSASNRTIREILNEEEERTGHRLNREALSTPPRTTPAQFPGFSEMARLSPDAYSSATANESSGGNDDFMRSIGSLIASSNMGMSAVADDDDDDDADDDDDVNQPMPTLRMMEDSDARLDRELADATEALTEAENAVEEGRRAAAQVNFSRENPPVTVPALRSGIMPLTFVVRSNGSDSSPSIERREALREAIESTT